MSTTHINEPTEQGARQVAIQLGGEVLLRDYFAAKALQALIQKSTGDDGEIYHAAEDAYSYADAMLREREAT